MDRKRVTNHGGGRDPKTEEREFTREPNVQPGRPPGSAPPDPGHLQHPRQSGTGSAPPDDKETARPRDTGRKGA